MRRFFTLFGAIVMLVAAPALADVTVRYRVKDQPTKQVVIAVADNGHVRFDSGDGSVLIVRDGIGYFVSSDRQGRFVGRLDDGLALITEFVSGLMEMMQALEAQAAANRPPAAGGQAAPAPQQGGFARLRTEMLAPYEVTERGRETVAGRSGIVYAIAPAGGGQGPTLDVVIATDGDLAPVGREMRRLIGLATAPANALLGQTPDMLTELDGLLARGVPIRMGQQLTLTGVSAEPIPAASFELPGPVLTREQLRGRMANFGAIMPPAPPTEGALPTDPEPEPDPEDE
jgi:hypothetical protein